MTQRIGRLRQYLNKNNVRSLHYGICSFLILLFVAFAISCNNDNNNNHDRHKPVPPTAKYQVSEPDTNSWPSHFGFGRRAVPSEIFLKDIDIMPDGEGLPDGKGNVSTGREIYTIKCAACHGKSGREGPQGVLVGSYGDTTRAKTIGNYWPYSTTIFDYIRRAMPYNEPGSLTNDEVYSLTAYLLYSNKIVDSNIVIDKSRLPEIQMPAKKYFVDDDRKGGKEVR